MLIVIVDVHVKPECVEAFAVASADNSRHSLQEAGIARFDVIQRQDDPTHFQLIEVYHNLEATAAHKDTAHYARWRDSVADMMAQPRSSSKWHNVSPDDSGW